MKKSGVAVLATAVLFLAVRAGWAAAAEEYAYNETKELVALVNDAARLIKNKGEAVAFREFGTERSKWRHDEIYIFVLDTEGNMIIHPDPELEGKNQLDLKDVGGKPIIKGIIKTVTGYKHGSDGWYHYQWTEPGGILAVWKSTFCRLVRAPSGKVYIVCAGLYNMKMEKAFVVDKVTDAVEEIEMSGSVAFGLFRNPTSTFLFKDTYIFVIDENGTDLVNPAFPNLEGRNLMEVKDIYGKYLVKEMMDVVKTKGSGWVDYMWPKPGETASSTKSSYVVLARYGDKRYVVGCGVYLEGAAKKEPPSKMTAADVSALVRDAAALLEKEGDAAFEEFRRKPSKWFHDETYLFIYDIDGNRVFYPVEPQTEGKNFIDLKDVRLRPVTRRFIDVTSGKDQEGWAHYMWLKPNELFPAWKSSFLRRVRIPSGKIYIVGCGAYNMKMEKDLISAIVDEAAALVENEGKAAFGKIRDKTGPFVFRDTYVFVDTPDGVELVNGAFPSVEGKNLMTFRDASDKYVVEEYINAALKKGSAWVTYLWPKPGETNPSIKYTYVKKATFGDETFIVGSGVYMD